MQQIIDEDNKRASYIEKSKNDILVENLFSSMPATIINGLILVFVLWNVIPKINLIIWLSANIGFVILRYFFLYIFKNTESNFLFFKILMITSFFIAGIMFGSSGIFLIDPSRFEYVMFLYFLAGGMVVGSAGSYHNNLPVYFIYSAGVFFIPTIAILMTSRETALPMVLLGVMFYILTSITAIRLNRDLSEFLGLRFDNMKLVARLNEEKQNTDNLNNELVKKNKKLKDLSLIDPLTGLKNRRYLFDIVTRDIDFINTNLNLHKTGNNKRATKINRGYGVFMIDIDHFKKVNDQYGHDTGDIVLKFFSQILVSHVRIDDVVVRFGGEEFIIILKNTEERYLSELAEAIRVSVESAEIEATCGERLTISCSLGFVFYPFIDHIDGNINLDKILFLADKALYYAKNNGRNMSVQAVCVEDNEERMAIKEITENLSEAIEKDIIGFKVCSETNENVPLENTGTPHMINTKKV